MRRRRAAALRTAGRPPTPVPARPCRRHADRPAAMPAPGAPGSPAGAAMVQPATDTARSRQPLQQLADFGLQFDDAATRIEHADALRFRARAVEIGLTHPAEKAVGLT